MDESVTSEVKTFDGLRFNRGVVRHHPGPDRLGGRGLMRQEVAFTFKREPL